MPRKAREKSKTGIYHVILRGANRQEVFHDDEDNIKFLEILLKQKKDDRVKVHGWCLMGNHAHLVLKEGCEDLSVSMKRIGVSYAWHYNLKYNTTGHLFQDRYRSERIEKDKYLLTVIRYIHQNPLKAGLVKRVEDWRWSSCLGYYGKEVFPQGLLDDSLVLGLFSEDRETARGRFKEFNGMKNEDICLEDSVRVRLTDEEVRGRISELISGLNIAQVKSLPKKERDEIIIRLKGIEGVTQRQLARLLGVSPSIIFKA